MDMEANAARIELALTVEAGSWPRIAVLEGLARRAVDAAVSELGRSGEASELSLVFTDDAHSRVLNAKWRGRDRPTNVLSFPAFATAAGGRLPPLLGDIILAFETVSSEADLDSKPLEHHLLHLIVHGLLHLLGYDHEQDSEAEEMEATERRILARLAIPDPYA